MEKLFINKFEATQYSCLEYQKPLVLGPTQVKCRLLISSIFWKCWNLIYGISEKCQTFIKKRMLEIKSRHFT